MLKIINHKVEGLEDSMLSAGLPMCVDTDELAVPKNIEKLGNAKSGSGHDCFLKGIVVRARVKYPLYWTKQFQRYHFADIISSQSTMHRVTQMNMWESCNEWVDPRIIAIMEEKVEEYKKTKDHDTFMEIISSLPSGFEMEMDIITNYLQLKTIYNQRRHHKLQDWQVFCDWVEALPMFSSLCLGGK